MSRKSRMEDLREAKDRRMKKIAIGGSVLLVLVLAFEVPKMLHRGSASSTPPPAATTDTTATPTTPTTPSPGVTPVASLPSASTQLTNSDLPPKRSKAELFSFSHFAGKDPFVQQVQNTTLGSASGASAGSSGGSSTAAPANITAAKVTKASASSVRTLATTGAVKIQVNGRIETVRIGGSFPSSNPLFKLVSASAGSVKIGIANGAYASGAHAVSLTPGRTLTLVDTADGTRYKIRLLSAS